MDFEEASTKQRPDAGHYLVTVRPDLERRINRKARELKRLDTEEDSARARQLSIEITTLLFQLFVVRGKNVAGRYDDTFLKLSEEIIENYDVTTGIPLTHYFRYLYSRRRNDPASKNEQVNIEAVSLNSMTEESGDSFADPRSANQWDYNPALNDAHDEAPRNVIAQQENDATEAQLALFLALLISYLEHTADKRDHTDEKKLYTRVFFTEATTRSVKTLTSIDECEPFERHEHEIVATLELPLQDEYMAFLCRTIRELWTTDLKPEHKPIKPGDYSWQLSNGFICQYLSRSYSKDVTGAAISQQRKNFRKLVAKCGLSGSGDC